MTAGDQAPEWFRRIDRRIEGVDKRSEKRDTQLAGRITGVQTDLETKISEVATELGKVKAVVSRWQLVAVFVAGLTGAGAPDVVKAVFGIG